MEEIGLMPFLERSEEVRIYFETAGESGHWVTLVNGYTRPLSDFKAMARYLAERGFRVLTFDTRGVGKTDYPPGFSLDDLADDIQALWKHLNVDASHLLGISFGGTIAATLAGRKPTELKKLALVSTALREEDLASSVITPSRDPRRFMADMTRYFSPEFLAKNQMLVQGFIRQVGRTFQEPESALGARAQREAFSEFDISPLLPEIAAPTLVVHGDADKVVAIASAKKIAAGIPGAKFQAFEGKGHLLLVESAVALYETISTFFQSPA